MTRKYLEDLDQETGDVVTDGVYTVHVLDARPLEGKPFFWMDLRILGGPDDGRVVSVGVNVPEDGEKAVFYFRKKMRGFTPQISKAKVFSLPEDDQIEALCEAVLDQKVEATLSVQKAGQYEGSQQLEETKQIVEQEAAQVVNISNATTTTAVPATATVATTANAVPDTDEPPF